MTDHMQVYQHVAEIMQVRASVAGPVLIKIGDHNSYERRNGRGYISIKNGQCLELNLVHELSHHFAIELHMLDGVPNVHVKLRLEEIAQDVERAYGDKVHFMPNCESLL